MSVSLLNSPFNAQLPSGPILEPEDHESWLGHFVTWYQEQKEIPCLGCLISLVIGTAMLILTCFCCSIVDEFNREVSNRKMNGLSRAEWPEKLMQIVGQQQKIADILEQNYAPLTEIPILDIGSRIGSTGYIDFLSPEQLRDPIMRGVDTLRRPFIALNMTKRETGERGVVVLFQRYENMPLWVTASAPGIEPFEPTVGEASLTRLTQILRGVDREFQLETNFICALPL